VKILEGARVHARDCTGAFLARAGFVRTDAETSLVFPRPAGALRAPRVSSLRVAG
jgi:hypothetical protein